MGGMLMSRRPPPSEYTTAIGYTVGKNSHKNFALIACPDCQQERWVSLLSRSPKNTLCRSCYLNRKRGNRAYNWKAIGTTHKDGSGYVWTKLSPEDKFLPMAGRNRYYLQEHRYIMAKHMNRCLMSWEIVHHKNGIRDDNRIENLMFLPTSEYHVVDTQIKLENKRLHKRVTTLEARVLLLESELTLLQKQQEVQNDHCR